MAEKKEIKQASDFLTKHAGPWQKALGTPSNELRVALHQAAERGAVNVMTIKKVVDYVQAIKKADPNAQIGHVVRNAENAVPIMGVANALAHLYRSLAEMHGNIAQLKKAEEVYRGAGFGERHDWLRTPDNIAFRIFAEAHIRGLTRSVDLRELGQLIAKLDTGEKDEKQKNRDRFYRRLLDAEDIAREYGEGDARKALTSLLHWTRGIAGTVEEQWFGIGEAPGEVGERRRVSEHTVMFDLDTLRRQAEEAADQRPAMDVDELEKKLRRGVTIGRILSKPVRFSKAAWNRIKQIFSREKHTVLHDENLGVSNRHVELTFLPKNNTVRVFDLHQRREDPSTVVRPGRRLSVPIFLERTRQRESAPFSFSSKTAFHLLFGASAQLAEGHVFQVGANAFRIAKIQTNQVVLRGIDGPVSGRLFKFDPRKQQKVLIGSSPNAHIKLITGFHEA
ncbi:hypothetical protein HY571_00690 [Candidatus Micrarchaeota archaeon]|nr:hypothetical protein [Candidatus Micrarchaeota archaeon]